MKTDAIIMLMELFVGPEWKPHAISASGIVKINVIDLERENILKKLKPVIMESVYSHVMKKVFVLVQETLQVTYALHPLSPVCMIHFTVLIVLIIIVKKYSNTDVPLEDAICQIRFRSSGGNVAIPTPQRSVIPERLVVQMKVITQKKERFV